MRLSIIASLIAMLVSTIFPGPSYAANRPRQIVTPRGDIVLEIVGQTAIASPHTLAAPRIQYGYLSYLYGIRKLFKPGPRNETTALYTFYTKAISTGTSIDGPLSSVTRRGTTTLYRHLGAHGSFDNPDSFREGTPIQTSTLQQQVVIDTITRAFSAVNVNMVTAVRTFTVAGHEVRFGRVGDRFRTSLSGHLVPVGRSPPCSYIAGYAVEIVGRASRGRSQRTSTVAPDSLTPLIKYAC